jgi:hypothetical protein
MIRALLDLAAYLLAAVVAWWRSLQSAEGSSVALVRRVVVEAIDPDDDTRVWN